jgi:dienelactone hydrolase
MRWWLSLVLLVVWIGAAGAQQAAGPVGSPEGPWRMQIHWVPLDISGMHYLLQARVCRPAGEAPARVVVVAHGTSDSRQSMALPSCDREWARWFLDRGFIVVYTLRRGYGPTGGYYAEDIGRCGYGTDFMRIGLETARDIAATVDYAAALPFARPQGMVLVGQSAGGWGAIAYNSMPHPRVTAIVNMAGGRGGHQEHRDNNNCRPDLLAASAGQFGRTATTPMLWVYSENDSFFAPAIATALYSAYSQNGGKAAFERPGPFSNDGHRLFFGAGGSQIWGPLVTRYLAGRPVQ